jgi:hypothetical protein
LRFLDDDDWMKMVIDLTEFTLKAMTLDARPPKRYTSCSEELEEASEQLRISLPKILFNISGCRIAEDDGFEDLFFRS